MGLLTDLAPAFYKHTLTFVEKQRESGNVVSFIFRGREPLRWHAGQHGIFFFNRNLKGGNWRGFSVASDPEEGVVRIATRITDHPSPYKKALDELKPGDNMCMRGPFGPFHLDGSRRPVVFIAGGIGITPYRSLILNCARKTTPAPSSVLLLYTDNSGQYVFRNELDAVTASHPFITIEYMDSTRLPDRISASIAGQGNRAAYFVSGPVIMVKEIKGSLFLQGIEKKNIVHEPFFGL